MKNDLFTFFFDYKGGTYVSQVRASSPVKAVKAWAKNLGKTKINGLGLSGKQKLLEKIDEQPTQLEGLKNTWCCSALLNGQLALVHFTQTKE